MKIFLKIYAIYSIIFIFTICSVYFIYLKNIVITIMVTDINYNI
jgi:hypothetical protein